MHTFLLCNAVSELQEKINTEESLISSPVLSQLLNNENCAQNGQLNSLIYCQISGRLSYYFFYLFLKSFKGLLRGLWKIFPSEFFYQCSGSSNYLCTLWHFWWKKQKTRDIHFKPFPHLAFLIFVFFFTSNIATSSPTHLQRLSSLTSVPQCFLKPFDNFKAARNIFYLLKKVLKEKNRI